MNSGKEIRVLKGHTNRVVSLCFDAKGERLLSASWDKTARIWDVVSGKTLHVLAKSTIPLEKADFNADGRRVLTAATFQIMTGFETVLDGREYTKPRVYASVRSRRTSGSGH